MYKKIASVLIGGVMMVASVPVFAETSAPTAAELRAKIDALQADIKLQQGLVKDQRQQLGTVKKEVVKIKKVGATEARKAYAASIKSAQATRDAAIKAANTAFAAAKKSADAALALTLKTGSVSVPATTTPQL